LSSFAQRRICFSLELATAGNLVFACVSIGGTVLKGRLS
jgi:hypothetical protein